MSYPIDQLFHVETTPLWERLHKGVLHMLAMGLLFVITIEHMFDVREKQVYDAGEIAVLKLH